MKKVASIAILLVIFVSCSSEKYEAITGEWKCVSWTNESSDANKCKGQTHFTFNPDKTYTSTISNIKDSGDYKILSNLLYFTPDNKMEIVVKIMKLNSDTLQFQMNRGGMEEIMTLVDVKE